MSKKAAVPKYSRLSSDSVFRACFDLFRHRQNLDHAYQELEQCRCVACGQFAVCIDIAVVALVCAQFHCAGDRLVDEDSVRDIHSAVQVHIPVEQFRCDLACGGLGLCGLGLCCTFRSAFARLGFRCRCGRTGLCRFCLCCRCGLAGFCRLGLRCRCSCLTGLCRLGLRCI